MTIALSHLDRFRLLVAQRLGLLFDEGRFDSLAAVLHQRVRGSGAEGTEPYLHRLASGNWRDEMRALAEELTVTETYFFRNPDHFRAFTEAVVPDMLRARRELRVLSAGCASGEEPYTLAILLQGAFSGECPIDIRGVDANPAMLKKAAQGRYPSWSLRETPKDVREACFRADGRDFVLDGQVRRRVTFEERNLAEEDSAFWRPGTLDVVFCRNVTMYLTPDATRAVVARIARALVPGGYLFLGHAETLRGVSNDFHLRHTHGTFYYQKRDEAEARALPADPTCEAATPSRQALPDAVQTSDSWVDAIRQASDRIAALARHAAEGSRERPREAIEGRAAEPKGARRRDDSTLELMRQERFAEAMARLAVLPAAVAADPDTQLLRAALLTNRGDLAEAGRACARILETDDLNAGARYLTALAREHAGDRSAAVENDQAAVYLDPAFAMPHLHLGLMARRAGDLDRARHELAQARTLLAREDAFRIVLFGGGFSREALVLLCEAELGACGGAP